MLVAYAYGLLRDHARAEDVVHEAYVVVMDKYGEFKEGTSMVAWCHTIVRFKVSESTRKERRIVTRINSVAYWRNQVPDLCFELEPVRLTFDHDDSGPKIAVLLLF